MNKSEHTNQKPEEIRAVRLKAGLTQEMAAALIGYKRRTWQEWEYGNSKMRRLLFQAFMEKIANS